MVLPEGKYSTVAAIVNSVFFWFLEKRHLILGFIVKSQNNSKSSGGINIWERFNGRGQGHEKYGLKISVQMIGL